LLAVLAAQHHAGDLAPLTPAGQANAELFGQPVAGRRDRLVIGGREFFSRTPGACPGVGGRFAAQDGADMRYHPQDHERQLQQQPQTAGAPCSVRDARAAL
jgi:hypothetical protein